MLFYFAEPGEPLDQGIDFPDADSALQEAAETALAMAREQGNIENPFRLDVSSDAGLVGSVTVQVLIDRKARRDGNARN